MDQQGLLLRIGGTLEYHRWNRAYRAFIAEHATDRACRFLFQPCKLEDGVTVRDVFMLIAQHLDILAPILGPDCREIVAEGLQPGGIPSNAAMEFVELYWRPLVSNDGSDTLHNVCFPEFHGIASRDMMDEPDWVGGVDLSGSPADEIADLPLKLRQDVAIWNEAAMGEELPVNRFGGCEYTLGDIFQGIVNELSLGRAASVRQRQRRAMLA